ncbi:MAG TPA: hypothetical protein VIQ74_11135 [Gemmatimonadaceae bacterium]|jgi:hypothetical protein
MMTEIPEVHAVNGAAGAARPTHVALELAVAWLWVGVPAVWGIWHVLHTSLQLFAK